MFHSKKESYICIVNKNLNMEKSRRNFLKTAGAASALLGIGGVLPGFSAASYSRIAGANERIRLSVVGLNGRGTALSTNFAQMPGSEVATVCDCDRRVIGQCIDATKKMQSAIPKGETDFRKSLADKDIDAVVIAMPDHWHTPAAILALQAGKHVYLEKPVSHNPREGEMLIEATAKYGKTVQIGNQRRSWPNIVEAIQSLQGGAIGRIHSGRMWYANARPGIGAGKITRVPDGLDWDMWQGPAPRTVYKDNIVHYNWHWFWHWGTAESGGNGVHMVDLLCWGMNLKYPKKISSAGGRYYHDDDWETPDTQIITLEYDRAVLSLEANSCNGKRTADAAVGVIFYGDSGSLFISGGNEYTIFDQSDKVVKDVKSTLQFQQGNTIDPSQHLDMIHFQNFFDGIRKGTPLTCTAETGHQCTALMLLGNIALRTGRTLDLNPANGHIVGDSEAQRFWGRSYEPGWEPKV